MWGGKFVEMEKFQFHEGNFLVNVLYNIFEFSELFMISQFLHYLNKTTSYNSNFVIYARTWVKLISRSVRDQTIRTTQQLEIRL